MASPPDLPRRRLTILAILAERGRSGADITREIESEFGDGVHRSTVHHHLSELRNDGLAAVEHPESGSGRAHKYVATNDGTELVRRYASFLAVRVQGGELYRG